MHVRGKGPSHARIAFVGEGPGWQEDREGEPFVGKTGDEIDRLLEANHLPSRKKIWLDNVFREYRGKDYKWTQADLEADIPELIRNLQMVLPTVIVTLGRWATRLFLGDVDMDGTQGIPWLLPDDCDIYPMPPEGVVVFPIIHPAAGMHNPEMSPYVVDGFTKLAEFLAGTLKPRRLFDDPYPEPHYDEITTIPELAEVFERFTGGVSTAVSRPHRGRRAVPGMRANRRKQPTTAGPVDLQAKADAAGSESPILRIHVDTEGWPGRPWSLQFSFEPGSGYLIRASAHDILRGFVRILRQLRPRITYHSALHDRMMFRSLGANGVFTDDDIKFLLGLPFDDTMVMAYLLQLEAQGLKAGCLRHCNMRMQEFSDVMGDVSNALARDYLVWIYDSEQVDYEQRQKQELIRLQTEPWTDKRGKTHQGRRVKKLPALPKTPLHKAVTRVIQSKRPRELWEEQVEDIQVAGYNRLGPLPQASLDYVPASVAIPYGARDADGTGRLRTEYSQRIDSMGLRSVYDLELSTYPLIDRMQHIGILPDLDHFKILSDLLEFEIGKLRAKLESVTGIRGFNPNSGDQVAAYLFDTLGLQEIKILQSGRGSTNDKILEALEHEHPEYPVITDIREYRELYKLKYTFVDRIPDFINRWPFDGRVHTTFRTTRVVTGRLAASDPNVLAQPEHGKWAQVFKLGWVAGKGISSDPEVPHVLAAWDYSQIELRGLAHLSQDPLMLATFRGERRNPDGSEIDLHAALAQRIFGVEPKNQDKHKHRLPAKAINFGIPMGMTNRGLSVELRKNGVDADEDTAQRWLDDTHGLYTGIQPYMDQRIAEAERNGFVRCLSGRIRYIGGIRSRDERVREEARRFAFSTPIQESAQYVMKQAEARLWALLQERWRRGEWVEPLLQVHDALRLEAQEGLEQNLHKEMVDVMTKVPHGFSVPLAIEGEYGTTMAAYDKDHHSNDTRLFK